MGLAASQVRMLSLTSRKASIERDILQGSNRKVALSREMNNLANEYYDALSAERLMYLSDTGEYTNLSYQYLMGKPGGVEDIDVKSDSSMILLDTESGNVVLSQTMYDTMGFTAAELASSSENIYIAIARLCGDTNVTCPEGYSGDEFIISPKLIKDICAGKYDTFDEQDLANAINNQNYCLYGTTEQPVAHTHTVVNLDTSMNSMMNTVSSSDVSQQLANIQNLPIYNGFTNAYENDEYFKYNGGLGTTLDAANELATNCVRNIATRYFGKTQYKDLTFEEKLAVVKILDTYNVSTTTDDPATIQKDENLFGRTDYAVFRQNANGNYAVYIDPKLIINALYTATHINNEYNIKNEDVTNVYQHFETITDAGDTDINVGSYLDPFDPLHAQKDLVSTLGKLFELSDENNAVVQISGPDAGLGADVPAMVEEAVTNFVNKLVEHSYGHLLSNSAKQYMNSIKNQVIEQFSENIAVSGIGQGLEYTTLLQNVIPLENAPSTFSNAVITQQSSLSEGQNDTDRLASYVMLDGDAHWYTFVDASALMTYFYAAALGENLGYFYNNDFYNFTSPGSNPNGTSGANSTTKGAYTPILSNEDMTKLVNIKNASAANLFGRSLTTETTYTMENVPWTNPNTHTTQNFVPAGSTYVQWIKNFKDLINDVKFYFPIVTACAKHGITTDYSANLNDSDYLDKNLQNGVFQLMGFETDVFALNSNKDTDYYLLTSEFSKMNDPAQQAIITAWYESEKAEITSKETYWDTLIENLSTELNSIKTEIESVQTLIDDAVKNTFDWGKG